MMNNEFRIFASNDEFPEGKMYYPQTMHELHKDRGFMMNQFGNVVHTYYKHTRSSSAELVWARIGFNGVEIMLAIGRRKDINGKQLWEDDIVVIRGGVNDGRKGIIQFDEEEAAFVIKRDSFYQPLTTLNSEQYEVVGNIHENGELVGIIKE